MTTNANDRNPATDLPDQVIRLARAQHRLPPGDTYDLKLYKPLDTSQPIICEMRDSKMKLLKYFRGRPVDDLTQSE